MSEVAMPKLKVIKISELINDLKSGVTRLKKEDLGFGSIEEKYSLTFTEIREIIAHPKLKGIRVSIPSYVLIDDTEETVEFNQTTISVAEPVIVEQIIEEEPMQLAEIKIVQEVIPTIAKRTNVPFI